MPRRLRANSTRKRVSRAAKPQPKPVTVAELKVAILRTIVREFAGRQLSWETVEEALREVNIEVKMAALRGGGA